MTVLVAPRVPRVPRGPRGLSLVELLIALTLLAVVLSAVVGLAAAQQRAYGALAARRAARAQLRAAALVLARELRPTATGRDGDAPDLREASDSAVELLATTGAAIACAVPDAWTVELPADDAGRDATLAWWTAMPRPGDAALLLDVGPDPAGEDDRWLAYDVVAVGSSVSACEGSAFTRGAPRGGVRLALAGPTPIPATVGAGVPVRLARRRRWTHYRAGDGTWHLGLREWDGASWSETQPVAGPFRAGVGGGLSVTTLDAAGGLLPGEHVAERAAALRLVLRADPTIGWRAGRDRIRAESAIVDVVPRGVGRRAP